MLPGKKQEQKKAPLESFKPVHFHCFPNFTDVIKFEIKFNLIAGATLIFLSRSLKSFLECAVTRAFFYMCFKQISMRNGRICERIIMNENFVLERWPNS